MAAAGTAAAVVAVEIASPVGKGLSPHRSASQGFLPVLCVSVLDGRSVDTQGHKELGSFLEQNKTYIRRGQESSRPIYKLKRAAELD